MRRKTLLRASVLTALGAALTPLTACASVADAAKTPYRVAASSAPELPDFDRVQAILAGPDPVTWVMTGDSITQGAQHTYGWRHYAQHFEERIRWELRRKWDFVINTGVSGERADHILTDFVNRVARFTPAVVSIMVGTNDAISGMPGREAYRANLTQLVQHVRDIDAVPLLVGFNPVASTGDPNREDLSAYAQIMREVAEGEQAILIDNYAHWEAQGSEVIDSWLSDVVHPNAQGHLALAHKVFEDLRIADPNSAIGSLRIG